MNDLNEKNWNSIFLGKYQLSSAKLVKNDVIKFGIELLSGIPNSFPPEVNIVNCFSHYLEHKQGNTSSLYIDDKEKFESERIRDLENFLDGHYLFFKVERQVSKDSNEVFYNTKDLQVIRKDDDTTRNFSAFPSPYIKTNADNFENLLNRLTNNEYLPNIKGLSVEPDDYPGVIIIEVTKKFSNSADKYAFGPIVQTIFSREYGYSFSTEENRMYLKLTQKELNDFYTFQDSVIFLSQEADQIISERLKIEGTKITPKIEISKRADQDEKDFLKIFNEVCLRNNLYYSSTDLSNFHTAIKTQSLVILAGMSGTGKSQIVHCYKEALNEYAGGLNAQQLNKSCRLLFIPVRPFWQDDSDLLGYLDNMNGIYRPGEANLLDFIKEAGEARSEAHIVCLDEMNLARVEHYFSQFLSLMELDPDERKIPLYNDKMSGRVYNQNDYPSKLNIPPNVIFVGTVNLDESTYQFSDKVLDRANVITLKMTPFKDIKSQLNSFNKDTGTRETNKREGDSLEELGTYDKLKGMQKAPSTNELSTKELDLLWEINLEMMKTSDKIGVGMRVVKQIENYLRNLPVEGALSREEALDLQILQRVLTKIRGSESQLSNCIGTYIDNEYKNGALMSILEEYNSLSDFEYSREKVVSIAKELAEYGHTI